MSQFIPIDRYKFTIKYTSDINYISSENASLKEPYVTSNPESEDDVIEAHRRDNILSRWLKNYDLEGLPYEQFLEFDEWLLEDTRLTLELYLNRESTKNLDKTKTRYLRMMDLRRHLHNQYPNHFALMIQTKR